MKYENRHVYRNVYIFGVTLFLLIASLPIVVNGASAQDEPYSSEWLPWFDLEMGITSDIDTDQNRLSQKIDDLGNSHYLYVTKSDELTHLSDVSGVWESTLIYNGKVSTSAFDIDKYGNLHILFSAGEDTFDKDLVYRTNMGSEIIDNFSPESGNTPSITVDENMDVHIVYVESSSESNNETDDDGQNIRRLKYGVRNNNNQSWSFSFPNEAAAGGENSVSNPVIQISESNVIVGFYEYDSVLVVTALEKLGQNSWAVGTMDWIGGDLYPHNAAISIDATSDYYVITYKSHVDDGTVTVRVCQYGGSCSGHSIGAATNFEQPHDDRLSVPQPVVKVDDNNHVIHVFYVEYGLPALNTDGEYVYYGRVAIHWWCIEDCASTGATNPSQEMISWTAIDPGFIDADRRTGAALPSGFGTHRSSNQIGIKDGSVVFAAIDYHDEGALNLLHQVEKLNGCMEPEALNYDEEATIQNSYPHNEYVEICTYPIIESEESEEVPGFGILTLLLSIMIATITRSMKVEE